MYIDIHDYYCYYVRVLVKIEGGARIGTADKIVIKMTKSQRFLTHKTQQHCSTMQTVCSNNGHTSYFAEVHCFLASLH